MSFLSSSLMLISINLCLSVPMDCEASSQSSALQCGSCLSMTFSALDHVNGIRCSAAPRWSNVDPSVELTEFSLLCASVVYDHVCFI